MKILIKNARVVDPANKLDKVTDILIENEIISKVSDNISDKADKVIDASGLIAVPGLIDLHTHLREPGFEGKETIYSGTRSAAKGGYTTVCMMPNTTPSMDSAEHLYLAQQIIKTDALVNVRIIAAITKDRKGVEKTDFNALASAGAVAVSDDGSPVENLDIMKESLQKSYALGLPLTSHAEDTKLAKNGVMNEGFISNKLGLAGISNASEYKAVEREIELVRQTKTALHICHVSTKESCDLIAKAKAEGLRVTAEATPHHFTLTEAECETFSGNAKMNPPLRSKADVDAIKAALKSGVIDAIATDHAPHASQEKEVEFELAMFGIIGLETAFALSYQTLVETGLITLNQLIELMSVNPSKIFKIDGGALTPGKPADITLIDLNKTWVYSEDEILSSSRNTPYIGRELKGQVAHVFVRGKSVFKDGKINE